MLGYHNSFNGSTIVEILRSPAEHTPNQIAYTFLLDGESTEAHLTYGQLDQKARAIGSRLTTMGVSQQHALLIYPPGLDYINAFLDVCMLMLLLFLSTHLDSTVHCFDCRPS